MGPQLAAQQQPLGPGMIRPLGHPVGVPGKAQGLVPEHAGGGQAHPQAQLVF